MVGSNDFHARLRGLRALAHLTQIQLAEKVRVSQNTISTWERGESSPQVPELQRLCDLFAVSADYLCCRTDHPLGLPPDSYLVDLDVVDALDVAVDHSVVSRMVDPLTKKLVWSVAIPRRARIVDRREAAQINLRCEERLAKLARRKK